MSHNHLEEYIPKYVIQILVQNLKYSKLGTMGIDKEKRMPLMHLRFLEKRLMGIIILIMMAMLKLNMTRKNVDWREGEEFSVFTFKSLIQYREILSLIIIFQ